MHEKPQWVLTTHAVEGLVDGGRPLHAAWGGDVNPDVQLCQARDDVLVPERRALLPSNPVLSVLEIQVRVHRVKAGTADGARCKQADLLPFGRLQVASPVCMHSVTYSAAPNAPQLPVCAVPSGQTASADVRPAWLSLWTIGSTAFRDTDWRRVGRPGAHPQAHQLSMPRMVG